MRLQIINYVSLEGVDVFDQWLRSIRDKTARAAIGRRILRLGRGNAGDHRYLRNGVTEMRIDIGPGYRAYYGQVGEIVVLLLCGGDKSSQDVDIERAIDYLAAWKSVNRK
ncbi:MAG: type II toxin-antitoxin system RelE/ParE family toxin [Burkholderiaceae bacterium]|nr:type II toxin-antitoxin system RelE/ParE family toxin [Burkholderiaceae bacterium]